MTYFDPKNNIQIDAHFEGSSAGDICKTEQDIYAIAPKTEPIPQWFQAALDEHFNGAGVPREYAFHVRVRSSAQVGQQITLRCLFTQTSGRGYMDPPYWIQRGTTWYPIPSEYTHFVSGSHTDLIIDIEPDACIYVSNKPYRSPTQVYEDITSFVNTSANFQTHEIGRTAENRPLLALESEPRPETILIGATMQPAEPAARPVMAVAHWLNDRSALSQRLLERFQFCLIPLPNPDGAAHGHSVTNAIGEVPMFSFHLAVDGQDAPLESSALWSYSGQIKPTAYMEFHTHYQDTRFHKLNPMSLDWFPSHMHERIQYVDQALMGINSEWRVTPLTPELPLVECGKFANLSKYFSTLSYCYQIYTITEEATCAHAVSVVSTLAQALAGPAWQKEAVAPKVIAG